MSRGCVTTLVYHHTLYFSVLTMDSIHTQCQVFIDCLSYRSVLYHDSCYLIPFETCR